MLLMAVVCPERTRPLPMRLHEARERIGGEKILGFLELGRSCGLSCRSKVIEKMSGWWQAVAAGGTLVRWGSWELGWGRTGSRGALAHQEIVRQLPAGGENECNRGCVLNGRSSLHTCPFSWDN